MESNAIASRASEAALAALARGDTGKARTELTAVPKRIDFAETGWKVALVGSLLELANGKRKTGLNQLVKVFQRLNDTSLSGDDKGYLRLFALYRAIEHSRDGRAPAALRDHAEDFRFDTTLVNPELKKHFPLKRVEKPVEDVSPPPFPSGMGSSEVPV
ncbi:hypothetical protein [Hyphobacterium sp.]|uniref:hypothetical protein n=1 Tax=Hyphobacterium sp. TaxID=2004662 RepID=UPI003BA9366C